MLLKLRLLQHVLGFNLETGDLGTPISATFSPQILARSLIGGAFFIEVALKTEGFTKPIC